MEETRCNLEVEGPNRFKAIEVERAIESRRAEGTCSQEHEKRAGEETLCDLEVEQNSSALFASNVDTFRRPGTDPRKD